MITTEFEHVTWFPGILEVVMAAGMIMESGMGVTEHNKLGLVMNGCSVHCTTQPGSKRGSDFSFSSCAAPNYLVFNDRIQS